MLTLKPLKAEPPVEGPFTGPVSFQAPQAWPDARILCVDAEQVIFAEGDPADALFCLLSGTARICKAMADGRRHIGDFVFPCQVFGFAGADRHLETAEAVEPCRVAVYPNATIERLVAENAEARRALRAVLMDRLGAAQDRIMTLGSLSAGERLAAFLRAMAHRAGGDTIALPMSRSDLADYLGISVETASRLFTALRRRGVIRLDGPSHVAILDRAALDAAAGPVAAGRAASAAVAPLLGVSPFAGREDSDEAAGFRHLNAA